MLRWIGAAVLAVVAIGALYVGGAVFWNWFGHTRGAGEIVGQSRPAELGAQRDAAITAAGGEGAKRILFGDLHVHTTFSTDAFLWSLPIFGGEGVHPLADACDFARYCSQLDFFAATDHAEAITPVRWEETKQSIRQCNARSGDAASPDMVSFVGFEWTQVGRTPADHYGHKNVIFPGLEDDGLAKRAIAAAGIATQALRGSPAALNRWIPFLDWKNRQNYYDFQKYITETRLPADCDASKRSNELSPECFESATTPGDLVRKLDEQKLRYLLIPHGTSWGFYTPPGTTFDKQLEADMRPERQTLIEVMSGHGSSEEFRAWREVEFKNGVGECPAPSANYEPSCWRAGEIIRERCVAAGETAEVCDKRATDVRHEAANLGVAYHLLVSGEKVEDWLDSGQCRDCFVPPFQHRPRTSVQYGLAIRNFEDPANPRGFRWGFIGSSDNHRARPGTGYKAYDRLRQTEASGANDDEWRTRIAGPPQPATPTSTGITQQELQTLAGFQLTEVERQASFFTTGALAAVHTEGRTREQIFEAMERREVYATSGPRILLWFELMNGADSKVVPMGGETTLNTAPRFRVRAVGDFVQKPGCPTFAEQGLPENRLKSLCHGECYNPGDARLKIVRLEVVRIRPQISANEAVEKLIEDVWRTLPCNDTGGGCTAEFTDADFPRSGRDALYYVRAIQEATPRINGAGLRATRDASGKTTSVNVCYGDYRTSRSDDCVANVEERAWSSPIYVNASRR